MKQPGFFGGWRVALGSILLMSGLIWIHPGLGCAVLGCLLIAEQFVDEYLKELEDRLHRESHDA